VDYLHTKKTKQLYKALLSLENENEVAKFLGDLLTPSEIKEFSNRWQVAQLLEKKIPYGDIEKQTGMSTTTIARISKWLHGKLGGYRIMIKRMNTEKAAHHHAPSLVA